MEIESLLDSISNGGSSPFFFTCAIQSIVFGELGRKHQSELMEENNDFKEKMNSIRNEFNQEKLEQQILFRREGYELGRQFLIHQTALLNKTNLGNTQFQNFCSNYWPLNFDIYTVMEEQKELSSKLFVPLRVLIAQTEVTAYDSRSPESSYGDFCNEVIHKLEKLQGIEFYERPWKQASKSFICEAMNIHYIMQGVPTLLIFPYQFGDTYRVEMIMWSFNKGDRSIKQSKILTIDGFDFSQSMEQVVASVSAIIGMTRDAYMLAEYNEPVKYPKLLTEDILGYPKIKEMLQSHYAGLIECINLLKDNRYTNLYTPKEYDCINESLEEANKKLK